MPPVRIPDRIIIIRHAEKPDAVDRGVEADGTPDPRSLSPRGWQRAGALVRFFAPVQRPPHSLLVPTAIFAAGVPPEGDSKRPQQTVAPLAAQMAPQVPFVTRHRRDDVAAAMADVLARDGVVLMAWEHHRIPDLVARLVPAPGVPRRWPDDRFDMLWLFDRTLSGWAFSQAPQLLLAGDSAAPIT